MAGFLEDNKMKIKLSNTESVRSNIFKYTSLKKDGVTKDRSTAGYFLNTNNELINQMKDFLKCDTDEFIVDVFKTKEYILKMDEVIKMLSINDFHENLRDYFEQRNNYLLITQNFSIGKPECTVDNNNRLNIKFDNQNENVKKFRGIVIAILCDLIIEKGENSNIIYPVLKDDIIKIIKKDYVKNNSINEGENNDMREKFRKWLLDNNESINSVEAYIDQIDLMSKESINDGLITKRIFEIKIYEELMEIVPAIINSEKFKYRETNSNRINSAALNHYIKFLKVYYDKELFLQDVFIDEQDEYDKLCRLLMRKKNIILKGSPGVGKTFMAKRLAYSIIGHKSKDQILSVQFHQSFSYEDFIEGIRPKQNDEGKFVVTPGMFREFVETALANKDKKYYVIIDEINRGNLSKIFGELMKLIEADKRYDFVSDDYEYVILPYSRKEFKIPDNIFIIGTMNTADRSLAMVDYALRRRFAFYHVSPKFSSQKFKDWLKNKNGISENNINQIITKMNNVNKAICEDLSKDFEIGHSYFICNDKIDSNNFQKFYDEIIEYEILPLLQEYFIDEESKIDNYKKLL